MTAEIIRLPVSLCGAPAFHSPAEEIVAAAIVDPVDKGVSEYACDCKGGRHGLPDRDDSRGVVVHQGEDDEDAEQ